MKRQYVIAVSLMLISVVIGSLVYYSMVQAQSAGDYDPWYDINDDGKIDMQDIGGVARKFGTHGDPFLTKGGLLNDSGWIDITDKCGQYFNITHNLNTTNIIVDIQGKTTFAGGVHQRYLGLTGYKLGWSRTYGGIYDDNAYSFVLASDGGYALAGSTQSFGAGGHDFWLVKTDSAGNMEWNRTYGGTNGDSAKSLILTGDGGYAIGGSTSSFGAGSYDFWLVKTDSAGNMEWNRTYGGISSDGFSSVVQTSGGGYVVAGSTQSFGAGGHDFWLVKTDSAGNMEWNRTYGGITHDFGYSVIQTGDEGYAIIGSTQSFGAGAEDFWLIKTDLAGDMEWNRTYGGIDKEIACSIVQTGDDGYVLAGHTRSFGAGSEDFWLVKTDSAGNAKWNQTYGGANIDCAESLILTGDGGYSIGGRTRSFGAGSWDFWLVKIDAYGNMEWHKTYGGTGAEGANSVLEISDGGYALAGWTNAFYEEYRQNFWLVKTAAEGEFGIAWTDSDADSLTLYRGATDAHWNFVRVRIWQIKQDG